MNMEEYQNTALTTAKFDVEDRNYSLMYCALGLNGEAGEVAEKIKKMMRDGGGDLTAERRDAIVKELGDCPWYLNGVAHVIGFTLEDVAQANLDKILSRNARGLVHGSGDDR